MNVEEIIAQGDSRGPLIASNHIDGISRNCIKKTDLTYVYRNKVNIPPLLMVDDMLVISECGSPTNQMSAFLNSEGGFRNLRYGIDKCFKIHIGKDKRP